MLRYEWVPVLTRQLADDLDRLLAGWLGRQHLHRQHLVVGYDAGPLSRLAARQAAEHLALRGLKLYLADRPAPRPALAFALRNKQALAGLYVTSDLTSLSLDLYDGALRRVPEAELAPSPDAAASDAACGAQPGAASGGFGTGGAAAAGAASLPLGSLSPGRLEYFDIRTPYQYHLLNQIRTEAVRALGSRGVRMVLDTHYGAASGYLEPILRQIGFSHRDNFTIRCEIDRVVERTAPGLTPSFPDLEPLIGKVLMYRLDLGAAISRDGTELVVVNADGDPVELPERAQEALAQPVPDACLALLSHLEYLGEQALVGAVL